MLNIRGRCYHLSLNVWFEIVMKMFYVLLLMVLVSCKNEIPSESEENPSLIFERELGIYTFIFDKAIDRKVISTSNGQNFGLRTSHGNIASYRDYEGIEHFLKPSKNETDTISIYSKEHNLEIYFDTNELEGYTYLFKSGDTIKVNYKDGKPIVNVLNRFTKKLDFSLNSGSSIFASLFDNIFRKIPMPPKEILNDKDKTNSFYENYIKSNVSLLKIELNKKNETLDSIYDKNLISKEIFDYYKNKLRFVEYSSLAKTQQLKMYPKQFPFISDPDIKENQSIQISESLVSVQDIIRNGDTLLKYKYFHDFISNSFLPAYFEQQTKSSYKYDNFGKYYSRWDMVYDSIQGSDIFPKKVKEYLLLQYMGKIVRDLEPKIIDNYTEKFFETIENKNYKDLFKSEFQLKESNSYKLELHDDIKKVKYLEDVLNDNLGKVVFLNFWASWCSPCIKSIPILNALKKEYVNDDVVFIDLSTENNFDEWVSSKAYFLMGKESHNYIIINPYLSSFLKENHVDFIPRYLLFNKLGELVHQNAPGPESDEIRSLLNKYLKE